MMSTAAIVLLLVVGLAARVLATATRAAGRHGLSWMLTGSALITWCVATIASMLSSSRIGSLSSRLGLIVVLLALAGVVALLAWRASDSPLDAHRPRHRSLWRQSRCWDSHCHAASRALMAPVQSWAGAAG